ncbi:MAG: TetR family transcriptional regulator [Alphaproteobacteria bacterium]|nr:TetR family transcriptional regulator [Alphaproteobacteria bacterium]
MARVSREEKQRTHAAIVATAARLFREHGLAGVGVADVMSAAGLTHGGFYRHFASKDALIAAAFAQAVEEATAALAAADGAAARQAALLRYVDVYLSREHVDRPSTGCPLAALGGEARHAAPETADAAAAGMDRAIARVARCLPAGQARLTKARCLMSLLVGAITIARLSRDATDREAILAAAREDALRIVAP